MLLFFLSLASDSDAQQARRPIDGIEDNSFLIEEAYNQEPGVVQHIFAAQYFKDQDKRPKSRGWALFFTQEWPLFSQTHQISYSIPFSFIHEGSNRQDGIGDILINYRYQALEENRLMPAFAPRLSLIVPSGSRDKGTGNGVFGLQWNLPFSKKIGDRFATHVNYGLTILPDARARIDEGLLSHKHTLISYNLGASLIYAVFSRLHLMLEWNGIFGHPINDQGRTKHEFGSAISPGLRAAVIDGKDLQVVMGFATPIGTNRPANNYGAFLYFSLEHRFLDP
ncbi:MAG TPA: transporter [Candidatus Binatia bacterium]|nr:transporter [Candidatus Binatia bacterium]